MPTCAVKWCGKSSITSSLQKDGISFHKFPKCAIIKEIWIKATHRDENWFPNKNSVICSRHFTKDCYQLIKKRRLLCYKAVPTLMLPILGSSQNIPQIATSNGVTTVTTQSEMNSQSVTSINLQEGLVTTPVATMLTALNSECAADDVNNAAQHQIPTPVPEIRIPEGKEVILRVYYYLASEYEQLKASIGNDAELSALSNILQRTARATGVSEHTLTALLDEEKQSQGSVDDGGTPSKRQRIETLVDYYDCNSPIREEKESDSPGQDAAPPDDMPGEEQPQQHYVYRIDAVKQEVDEEDKEQLVILMEDDTEEDEHEKDSIYNETSALAGISCTSDTEMKIEPPDEVTTHTAEPLSDSTEPHTEHSHEITHKILNAAERHVSPPAATHTRVHVSRTN